MIRSLAARPGRSCRAGLALTAGLLLLLAGCYTPNETPPPPTPTPKRPFTVMSTDPIRVVDPAAVVDQGSAILAQNVYQRLMTADPGSSAPKPDAAARDCLFSAPTVVTCTLNTDLKFQNGHEFTSSDVKFSIERLTRLDIPGSSASLFSSLRRIETPDPLTVRFVLSRPDREFQWALASIGASVVDEEAYDADEIRAPDQPIIGSGPYQVSRFQPEELQLARFADYKGRTPGRLEGLVYKTAPDSGTIEEAIADAQVDVVWRGLNAAAVTRLRQQATAAPNSADGFTGRPLTGARVHQLLWNPDSRAGQNTAVRKAIALALQSDRTLDSIVPPTVSGYVSSFPVGGVANPQVTWPKRIQLTLSYDPTSPDDRDLANQIRSRLEDTGGLSVRLRPQDAAADLNLADRKAWSATPVAWLQPYLASPPESSREAVQTLEAQFRAATEDAQAQALVAQLQNRAASDLTVLPISQSDEYLFIRVGVDVDPLSFGPGWQLGFWGMSGG
ncbi:ABC transporter substrate-binding protein [Microlunatus speluncae]|uniref:ABC transporter substrate-binding protein n=1 Tax=Microlunatus speluncae TaxID=2594267 RepID=UPI0012661149|nr:ABC transporter substrate-binding protein [Microlunatus speluncae]